MNISESIIKEIFLLKLGSTYFLDTIYLFVITPMGIIGTFLMFFSLIVFLNKEFRNLKFFQYLQVYSLSSLIQAVCMALMFFKSPRFLFEISISMSARIFTCKILSSYVVALLFFYNDVIFILLNLERISQFTQNELKNYKKVNPYLACFILLVICELFNLPTHFVYEVATDQEIESALKSYQNVLAFKGLCDKTSFGVSSIGKSLGVFGYVIKGLITLLIDLASTMASAYYMIEFFKKKKLLQNPVATTTNLAAANENNNTHEKNEAEKVGVKQMKMIIYLSVKTVLFHVIIFVADVIILLSTNVSLLLIVQNVLMLVVGLKQILNFFFFFFFNTKFRKQFFNLFKNKKLNLR